MAYLPRYRVVFDGCTFHVTWRCHNKEWFFTEDRFKQIYYDLLLKYKARYGVKIHAYNFMSNHPHLIGEMESKEKFSNFFRVVNNLFARKYNKMNGRMGQVVMDRFKSPVIQTDQAALRVMIYVDLNPVRKNMVAHPKKYKWSSYLYYAHGRNDPLIDDSPAYLGMGDSPKDRQSLYVKMVEGVLLDEGFIKRDYSRVAFIGNPEWVKAKYDDLSSHLKNKRSFKIENRAFP